MYLKYIRLLMLINCSPCVLRIDQDATSSGHKKEGNLPSYQSMSSVTGTLEVVAPLVCVKGR